MVPRRRSQIQLSNRAQDDNILCPHLYLPVTNEQVYVSQCMVLTVCSYVFQSCLSLTMSPFLVAMLCCLASVVISLKLCACAHSFMEQVSEQCGVSIRGANKSCCTTGYRLQNVGRLHGKEAINIDTHME